MLLLGAVAGMAGCASIGPPEAPSLELPKPPSDLHAARKGDKVTLTWTIPARTTDRQSVRYLGKTDICRSVAGALKQCGTQVGQAAPPADFEQARKRSAKKLSATFTDTLPAALEQEHPTEFATYAVEVLNKANRGAGISNQGRVPLVPTLPPFGDFSAQTTAPGVLISWQCPATAGRKRDTKYLFRIYRHPESSTSETKIADVEATKCALGAGASDALSSTGSNTAADRGISSFLDQTFEWENTYSYRGMVVSVIEMAGTPAIDVEGDDTHEVKVFAHDVFPPAVPSGLQAVFSGPGQQAFIDLIWTPVADTDLDGYNVYRHEDGAAPVKVNSELVKTPAFRDSRVVAGKTYFYSVSAVDQRGNESARSEKASESVP
ncbi:MAG: hypothetical protein WCD48_04295 [Candidatus Sulfotelmatobacter sp.]